MSKLDNIILECVNKVLDGKEEKLGDYIDPTKQQIKDLIKSELQKYIREEPYKEEDFDTGWNNAIYAMQDVIEEL